MKAYFQKLNPDAKLPTRGSDLAAGYDLYAIHSGVIHPGQTMLFKTGLRLEMRREGSEVETKDMVFTAKVCSRSGLALKNSVFVLNAPGIIDEDYRGEIGVILHNAGDASYAVNQGDRVAQLLFEASFLPDVLEEEALSETVRGEGGFGSTDVEAKAA